MSEAVYLGLGANLGDRAAGMRAALEALKAHPAIRVAQTSAFYETPSLADASEPMYLNAVARLDTALEPAELVRQLCCIETTLGRVRTGRWQPRTIDLDLLLYGQRQIETPELTVPHPQMHLRSFVLRGLCELDGNVMHPVLGRTAAQLAERLNGHDFYRDADRPQLISIAGLIGVGKTTLAARLAEALGAKLICEKYDDNPYLADVYAGHEDVALDSELFFLSSSATQLRSDRLRKGCCYVSDYVFDKALIYASSWLSREDLAGYRRHYDCVAEQVATPAAVIYLTDTVDACLDRIHRRNRPYEQRIEPAFLAELKQKYEDLYARWASCPVIRLAACQCAEPKQAAVWADEIRHYIAR